MTIIYTDVSPKGYIDTDQLPSAYAYNADGTIASETVTTGGATWKKTYTYTTVNSTQKLSGNPAWVKQ